MHWLDQKIKGRSLVEWLLQVQVQYFVVVVVVVVVVVLFLDIPLAAKHWF